MTRDGRTAVEHWITGQLTPGRMERAKQAADVQTARYPEDRGDLRLDDGMPRAERIYQQNAAREFLAQVLGLDSVEMIPDAYKGRWSSQTALHAELGIAQKEIDAKHQRRWVLITGRAPAFTIQGWCWAHEATGLGEWRPKARRPAWFIPWTNLHRPPAAPSIARTGRTGR